MSDQPDPRDTPALSEEQIARLVEMASDAAFADPGCQEWVETAQALRELQQHRARVPVEACPCNCHSSVLVQNDGMACDHCKPTVPGADAQAGWQPIETLAYGIRVLLLRPGAGPDVVAGSKHHSGDDAEPYWICDGHWTNPMYPTHWMPLPAPPVARQARRRDERRVSVA